MAVYAKYIDIHLICLIVSLNQIKIVLCLTIVLSSIVIRLHHSREQQLVCNY